MKDNISHSIININDPPEYSQNTSGKFLFMRHGETFYNVGLEEIKNPSHINSYLSENGIKQAISAQNILNNLSIKKVYVSPYNRTLETATYALENHPNIKNIIAVVHPKLAEKCGNVHDYFLDIKKAKNNFNINSKLKVDWSLFDEYVKNLEWDENFFYFENLNGFDNDEKKKIYLKFKEIYDNDDIEKLSNELVQFSNDNSYVENKVESIKHVFDRFVDFRKDMYKYHGNTFDNENSKILCVTHSGFIRTITSRELYEESNFNNFQDDSLSIENAGIISVYL